MEDEIQLNNCYTCGSPGHLARHCTKNTKQTVQRKGNTANKDRDNRYNKKEEIGNKERRDRRWQNRNRTERGTSKERKKNDRDKNKNKVRPFNCRICQRMGHSYQFCTYYKRAKEILNNVEKSKAINLLAIASEDPESMELNSIKTYLRERMDWGQLAKDENPERIISTILTSPEIITYGSKETSEIGSGTDSENESTEEEQYYSNIEVESDVESLIWDDITECTE